MRGWGIFEGSVDMRGMSVGVDINIFVSCGCERCCAGVCV